MSSSVPRLFLRKAFNRNLTVATIRTSKRCLQQQASNTRFLGRLQAHQFHHQIQANHFPQSQAPGIIPRHFPTSSIRKLSVHDFKCECQSGSRSLPLAEGGKKRESESHESDENEREDGENIQGHHLVNAAIVLLFIICSANMILNMIYQRRAAVDWLDMKLRIGELEYEVRALKAQRVKRVYVGNE